MMKTDEQNKQFDALKGLTDGQREYLISQSRVAITEAKMDRSTAVECIGIDAIEEDFECTIDNTLIFGGSVITRSPLTSKEGLEEAEEAVERRGWGEKILGCLAGIAPVDDMDGAGLHPEIN